MKRVHYEVRDENDQVGHQTRWIAQARNIATFPGLKRRIVRVTIEDVPLKRKARR